MARLSRPCLLFHRDWVKPTKPWKRWTSFLTSLLNLKPTGQPLLWLLAVELFAMWPDLLHRYIMRGLRFGFVSTTLLSQVDASVGGKNGVNFRGYKNMLGVFNQPEFVIIDTDMLQTLDKKEFCSGFAEIVKAAAIKDESLFGYIESHYAERIGKCTRSNGKTDLRFRSDQIASC